MPSLSSLAEESLALAKKIDKSLEQSSRAYTTFSDDTLESLPEEAQKLRWDLLDLTHDLRQLVRGARLSGLDIAFNVYLTILKIRSKLIR